MNQSLIFRAYQFQDFPGYERQVTVIRTASGQPLQPTRGQLAKYAARELQKFVLVSKQAHVLCGTDNVN